MGSPQHSPMNNSGYLNTFGYLYTDIRKNKNEQNKTNKKEKITFVNSIKESKIRA